MLTVGKIVGGAFRLVKEKPVAVVIWSLTYLVSIGLAFFIIGRSFSTLATANKDPNAAMQQMTSMMGSIFLLDFAILILMVVLFTATQRAVLRPEQGGLAYMRLGMDELKMFALAFVMIIAFYIFMIVVMIVMMLVAGALAVAGGPAAAAISAIIMVCALVAAAFWFMVRVSLMFPLTMLTGNIAIGEGWRLSRGHFWTLFGGYFVIFLILVVMWVAFAAATMGPYFSALTQAGNDPVAMQQAMQAQMLQYSSLTPQSILSLALMSLLGGVGLALQGGAVATAAKELTVDREGMAKTFA